MGTFDIHGFPSHFGALTDDFLPRCSSFWAGTGLSILNYPTNFYDLVKSDAIKIHVADIDHISAGSIHLSEGTVLQVDAFICCTGWKYVPAIKFLPEGIEKDLGLPYTSTSPDPLVDAADKEILFRFPRLARQPVINPNLKTLSGVGRPSTDDHRQCRMYRFIAPPTGRRFGNSVAFCGMVQCINTAINAEIQGLWGAAYLSGRLVLDKTTPEEREKSGMTFEEERMWVSVRDSRFGRWRYPGGNGSRYPDFVFDALPYFDTLLHDLDLDSRRKGGALEEVFTPYAAPDYRGLLEQWMVKIGTKAPVARTF